MLLQINKNEVYLIENQKQKGNNMKVIKIYNQSILPNIFKTGSDQIKKMSFSNFFLFN